MQNIGFSTIIQIHNEDFEDVNEELLDQITVRGIVISYTSHAHLMLQRTSSDIDPNYNTYKNAYIHLFCSAELAHKMTKSSPHIISGCPYSISIYELSTRPNTIYLSYQNSTQPDYDEVITLLNNILSSVLTEYD